MTEPANVTTESGAAATGDRDDAVTTTDDDTAVLTENGSGGTDGSPANGGADADLVPDH